MDAILIISLPAFLMYKCAKNYVKDNFIVMKIKDEVIHAICMYDQGKFSSKNIENLLSYSENSQTTMAKALVMKQTPLKPFCSIISQIFS